MPAYSSSQWQSVEATPTKPGIFCTSRESITVPRTVVSGIAMAYTPEEMVGKKIVMVTNLKPAKLCGIMSEGMIVCAENDKGEISLIRPEKDMEDGSNIF